MDKKADHVGIPAHCPAAFPTTQWSLVVQAGADATPQVNTSLEALCLRYWYPIYAFLRRQGHPHHRAEDLTQGFFAHLLTSDALGRAAPERGRFRTFLLASLHHYTTSEWRRAHAAKRGGSIISVPLVNAEANFAAEPADSGATPEEAFDRNWARGLIQQTVDELRDEYAATGRATVFASLLPHLFGEGEGESQAASARQLGLNEHAFTVAVSRLRKRLRERLRTHVADTVDRIEDTDDELRILLAAFHRQTTPL